MYNFIRYLLMISLATAVACVDDDDSVQQSSVNNNAETPPPELGLAEQNALRLIEEGRRALRHETFGNEAFWGGVLRLHEAINGEAGNSGLTPEAALALGLKVDVDALPESVQQALAAGDVDLASVDTTVDLLRLDAVIGVTGFFDSSDRLASVGLNCVLCHSNVDDSFAPGIGRRVDGTPNRDLDAGAIIALAPNVSPLTGALGVDEDTVRTVLHDSTTRRSFRSRRVSARRRSVPTKTE